MYRLSRYCGRLCAALIAKSLGVLCFALMIVCYTHGGSPLSVSILYILRSSLMNSPKPLINSVLMDLVPVSQRARWNSVESINAASWAGDIYVNMCLYFL